MTDTDYQSDYRCITEADLQTNLGTQGTMADLKIYVNSVGPDKEIHVHIITKYLPNDGFFLSLQ